MLVVAGRQGFEPRYADPESAVLPLDDLPTEFHFNKRNDARAPGSTLNVHDEVTRQAGPGRSVKRLFVAMALLIAAAGSGATFVRVRNDLARQRDDISAAWAQVNDAMEQRSGLSRRMAERFQALGDPPASLLQEVAAARTSLAQDAAPQEKIHANDRLSAALSRVLLESERQPRVDADPAFRQMQEELRSVEDRIANARLNYNDALAHYNARIQSFPRNLVARLAGFSRDDAYFQTIPF